MNWIKFSEKQPSEYDKYYLLMHKEECSLCDYNEDHVHVLNFKRFRYGIGEWCQADQRFVDFYHAKGDHSWDWAGKDHWATMDFDSKYEVTHWMEFPQEPSVPERKE